MLVRGELGSGWTCALSWGGGSNGLGANVTLGVFAFPHSSLAKESFY